jgi:hypothetical protein
MAKASLDSIYRKVLGAGNQDANQMYPPKIFDEHFNTVTSFIVDRCVELYPERQTIEDIIRPFIKTKIIQVVGGVIKLPTDYRNYLNLAAYVKTNLKGACGCQEDAQDDAVFDDDPLAPNERQLAERKLAADCMARDVAKKDVDEFNSLCVHPYKFPTYKEPICCVEDGGELEGGIKICPFDITSVKLKYVSVPKEYRYGYTRNPDESFVFDINASIESEWGDNAVQYLFRGISTLFSVYTKNNEMRDWTNELKQIGLL